MDLSINMANSIHLARMCVHPSTGCLFVIGCRRGAVPWGRQRPFLPDPPWMVYQLDLLSQEKKKEKKKEENIMSTRVKWDG